MEYLFFIIYGIVIGELIHSKPIRKIGSVPRGCRYYRTSGFINIIVGMIGILAINTLLRDKGIISHTFVWIGLIGFLITMIYGYYCIYMMLVTPEP